MTDMIWSFWNSIFQLCASAHYSRRMLDLKSFQVREESYLPSKCNAGQNERRDFITRIRRHHPTHVSYI